LDRCIVAVSNNNTVGVSPWLYQIIKDIATMKISVVVAKQSKILV
jgi:hypothetical protein